MAFPLEINGLTREKGNLTFVARYIPSFRFLGHLSTDLLKERGAFLARALRIVCATFSRANVFHLV